MKGVFMSENKKKQAYWLEPSLVLEMENMLEEANATSKGDFVRQAIKFYMAFLRQGKSIEFLSPLLAHTIKSQVESVEQNLSKMLFKIAVEQSKVAYVVAYGQKMSNDTIDGLHEYCADKVAETKVEELIIPQRLAGDGTKNDAIFTASLTSPPPLPRRSIISCVMWLFSLILVNAALKSAIDLSVKSLSSI